MSASQHAGGRHPAKAESSTRTARLSATLCVFGLWAVLLVLALRYVARYASTIPLWDDLALVPWVPGDLPIHPLNLWEQHNEHRIPLAKLVLILVVRATGDFRAGMALSVLCLGATALAAMLTARRLRGRTSLSDVVFPLVWLNLGHGTNLLMAFQVALVLPMAMATGAALLLLRARRDGPGPSRSTLLAVGGLVLLLPLQTGSGAMHAGVWAAALGLLGALAAARGQRGRAAIAFAVAAAALALVAAYTAGLEQRDALQPGVSRAHDLGTQLASALRVLGLAFGPAGTLAAPWAGWLALALTLATLAHLVRAFASEPRERPRAAGLVALIGGVLLTAAAIGWSRARADTGGTAERYVVLVAPLVTALALAWQLPAPGVVTRARTRLAQAFPAGLALLLCVAFVPSTQAGLAQGRHRLAVHLQLVADVGRGFSTRQLAREHVASSASNVAFFARQLATLRAKRWPPYEGASGPDTPLDGARARFPMLVREPDAIEPEDGVVKRRAHERSVLLAREGTRLVYELGAHESRLRGAYGVPPSAWEGGMFEAVTVQVALEGAAGDEVLLRRELRPAQRDEDRGLQALDVPLPKERGATRLVLSTVRPADEAGRDPVWSFWTELALE